MKCERCGKVFQEAVEVCDNCGLDFDTNRKIKKTLSIKKEPIKYNTTSDLVDYPILTFITGLLSLIIPLYIFSFIAIRLSKKPSKVSLIPFANLGKVFGYFGFLVSTIFIGYILFTFVI
jgi:ribosomal protein L37E